MSDVPWASLSHFRSSGFSAQRCGTNGGMQRCYSLLVMLESQVLISFCVRDLIVFVCHCRQINCGVTWRTDPPPQPPSPLSVPLASHHSQFARVYLPRLSYPPLSVKLSVSTSPASYCLLSPSLCSFKAGSLLSRPSSLLHDLLKNTFRRCSAASQFLSSSRFPSPQRQDVPARGLIHFHPLSFSPSPPLS